MQKKTKKLLTVFDLENLTGRKVSTWRKAIAERKIPVVRIGRSVRVPYEFVERLIEDGWRDAVESATKDSKS